MPYSVDTVLVAFGGGMGGGEVWQCGLRFEAGPVAFTAAGMAAVAAAAVAPLTQFWTTSGAMDPVKGQPTTLTRLRTYAYQAGETSAVAIGNGNIALPGSGSTWALPDQCALVCSLRTDDPSRKGRGRIYLPATGVQLQGGQVGATVAQGVATGLAAMITSMNAALGAGPCIGGTSGSPVTRVLVDSLIDTQRRRRNKLVPSTTAIGTVSAG